MKRELPYGHKNVSPEKLNSSELILWRLIPILHTGMAFLHEEEDDHNTTDERKEYGVEDSNLKRHISLMSS